MNRARGYGTLLAQHTNKLVHEIICPCLLPERAAWMCIPGRLSPPVSGNRICEQSTLGLFSV